MKKLSVFNKLVFITNYVFAIALLLGFVLPFIAPQSFPRIAVMSLAVPVLFLVNIIFVIYWLITLKRQFLLSFICLFVGYYASTVFFKITKSKQKSNNELRLMNYNVRLFNAYNWFADKNIPTKIKTFVEKENPDILCVQEYHPLGENLFNFKYKYIETRGKSRKFGQAIYSKYKIVNKGSLDFKSTQNNTIFVDIVKNLDTLRVYNIHLESLGLNPNKENFGQKTSEKLLNRLANEFVKQQNQVNQILKHQKKCKYPILVSGDFNNTAYSWAYKSLKGNMHDSYLKAGIGFGKTFDIKNFPMRIDFVFADKILQINQHKNYNVKYSDHTPILAIIGLD